MRTSSLLICNHCRAKEWHSVIRLVVDIIVDKSGPDLKQTNQTRICCEPCADSLPNTARSIEHKALHGMLHHISEAATSGHFRILQSAEIRSLLHTSLSQTAIPSFSRQLSTGGLSRKDYLWGISGSRQSLQQAQSKEQISQEERTQEPDFFAQLEKEGYSNIQEALQRVIIGAYQLLQEDRVEQAESMVDEGDSGIACTCYTFRQRLIPLRPHWMSNNSSRNLYAF